MRSYHRADWVVYVDKREYYITQEEYELLKQAALAGRTQVWFEDIVLSVPHISSMERTKKTKLPEPPRLEEPGVKDMSAKIAEAKAKIFNKS